MESLIYDRTLSDITNLTRKGQYNASDLNRVESWTKHLNNKFNELGYRTERKLDYIESTGTQYIDTGIVPNSKTRMKIKFKLNRTDVKHAMGWGSSGSQEAFLLTFAPDAGFRTSISSSYKINVAKRTLDTNIHEFDIQSGSQEFDGVEYATDTIGDTATTGQTLYLFGLHAEWTTAVDSPCFMNLYECQIWQGEELKRDYVPAIDPNGVVCLYDKVTKTYFYNKGTGEFIAGYGEGYKERPITVEYIESTGTQYIDTGIKTTNKTRFELDVKYTRNNVSSTNGVAGFATNTRCCLGYSTDFTGFYFGVAGVNTHLGTKDLNRHQFYIDYKNSKFGINDLGLSGDITTQIAGGHNILLFARNNGNSNPDLPAYEKLYGCKIYEDDVLVRDYIPAIDPNNIVCLYDKVGNTYFYNKGTGNFKVGYKELANPVYEVKDFTDTSLFNVVQHSTRTLVNEETPISNSFIRLSKTQYEYPASGFTLKDKELLQFDGNVVACILYKYTSDTTNLPRVGWSTGADGYSCWNVTSSNFWGGGMVKSDTWTIKRVKYDRTNYNKVRTAGCFGFCQLLMSDNVVLDVAGISFYNLTDEQYADTDYINSLGVAGFGASAKPWEPQDDFVLAEADRIIHNINVLRSIIALYNDTPATPETMRFLDYIKANNIEKILFDMDKLVNNMANTFKYSGTFYSGEVGLC